jgi:hypothetical protein
MPQGPAVLRIGPGPTRSSASCLHCAAFRSSSAKVEMLSLSKVAFLGRTFKSCLLRALRGGGGAAVPPAPAAVPPGVGAAPALPPLAVPSTPVEQAVAVSGVGLYELIQHTPELRRP